LTATYGAVIRTPVGARAMRALSPFQRLHDQQNRLEEAGPGATLSDLRKK
jgi:hypothetical protein